MKMSDIVSTHLDTIAMSEFILTGIQKILIAITN